MDNFKIIYRILKYLERAMDFEEFDIEPISAEMLEISKERWQAILIMLSDEGYINGIVTVLSDIGKRKICKPVCPVITLKGLEYLEENSFMKKAGDFLKGVKKIVPEI